MNPRHLARTGAAVLAAAIATTLAVTPAHADMSSAEAAEAEAGIAQVSAFVDEYVEEHGGMLPKIDTVADAFPYPDNYNVSWAYIPMPEAGGYCLDYYAFRGRTFNNIDPDDFRFYESTTGETFTPTQAFMNSSDPRPGACGEWSRADFPQPEDPSYPTATASATATAEATSNVTEQEEVTVKVLRFSKVVSVTVRHGDHKHVGKATATVHRSATGVAEETRSATVSKTVTSTATCSAMTQEEAEQCAADRAAEKADATAQKQAQSAADEQAKAEASAAARGAALEQATVAANAAPVTSAHKSDALAKAKKIARAKAKRASKH